MRIVKSYSHLNGYEHILVHKPELWQEIVSTIGGINIESIDMEALRKGVSKESLKRGELLYDATTFYQAFAAAFKQRGWNEADTGYTLTAGDEAIRPTLTPPPAVQARTAADTGHMAIHPYIPTNFVKDRIAVEVQLGKYAFVAYDLFVKHMAFYIGDVIDVGIEILPMKEMQAQMSSGIGHYEGEIYNILRHGRSTPAVPLVIVGIAA